MFLVQALKKKFTLAENTLDIAVGLVIIRLVRSKSSFKNLGCKSRLINIALLGPNFRYEP